MLLCFRECVEVGVGLSFGMEHELAPEWAFGLGLLASCLIVGALIGVISVVVIVAPTVGVPTTASAMESSWHD